MLRSFTIFAVCLLCSACAFFDAPEPSGEVIDVTAQEVQGGNASVEVTKFDDMDLMHIGNSVAGNSVEIFSLDQPLGAEAASPVSKDGVLEKRYRAPQIEVFSVGGEEEAVDPVGMPLVEKLVDEMSSDVVAAPVEGVETDIEPIDEIELDMDVEPMEEIKLDIEREMEAEPLDEAQ